MQRISFDFMTRRIKQFALETFVRERRGQRNLTVEQITKLRREAEYRKQFVPVTRWGSFLPRAASHADSRPIRRRLMRVAAFNDITNRFPGEPRKTRRRIAFDLVRNMAKLEKAA